jgi:DNA-binding XRE family transcriptional regulator
MNLSDRFRAMREKWCLSQTDMAIRVGVTRNSWQRYEKGELPNGETLLRLAELGGNVQWLLTGKGPMMVEANAPWPQAEPQEGNRDTMAVLAYLQAENARLTVTLSQAQSALQVEHARRQRRLAEMRDMLAACVTAVDHLKQQQQLHMTAQQTADLIVTMLNQMQPPAGEPTPG